MEESFKVFPTLLLFCQVIGSAFSGAPDDNSVFRHKKPNRTPPPSIDQKNKKHDNGRKRGKQRSSSGSSVRAQSLPAFPQSWHLDQKGNKSPNVDGCQNKTYVDSLPSIGSCGHRSDGMCQMTCNKGCYWEGSKGCRNGWFCNHCHFCPKNTLSYTEEKRGGAAVGEVGSLKNNPALAKQIKKELRKGDEDLKEKLRIMKGKQILAMLKREAPLDEGDEKWRQNVQIIQTHMMPVHLQMLYCLLKFISLQEFGQPSESSLESSPAPLPALPVELPAEAFTDQAGRQRMKAKKIQNVPYSQIQRPPPSASSASRSSPLQLPGRQATKPHIPPTPLLPSPTVSTCSGVLLDGSISLPPYGSATATFTETPPPQSFHQIPLTFSETATPLRVSPAWRRNEGSSPRGRFFLGDETHRHVQTQPYTPSGCPPVGALPFDCRLGGPSDGLQRREGGETVRGGVERRQKDVKILHAPSSSSRRGMERRK
uniref:TNFR-Cys domain-containing protein n=1 Tax=Chromera velia CCMP2878 TaxID=1169474 RepID=A0A0G4HQH7_9ALVE|eukprot:Cvel_7943.t1-p1 / transcript=Cvel_7943.t1 / gene=Cvel_7943 / organism=Chromera_velia_CCMP2878 / gene_product=hypothetical protein / transcript_product=hypothetical protein / location=Cvel_scaffold426:60713-62794(+) / protein_length=481 / sequence_SO=supercontig / SO=protein_coding / is_pseudo=false